MKQFKILLLLLPLFVYSCKDDDIDLITALLPTDEIVSLKTDSIHITASDTVVEKIIWKNSNTSLLLGTYTDVLFGVTTAEILSQFNCPSINTVNWPLPATVDSTMLYLSLVFNGKNAKKGDSVKFTICEIDKAALTIPSPSALPYYSNINVDDYTNKTIVLGNYTHVIKTVSADTLTTIRIPLDNALKERLIAASINNQSVYSSENAFVQFFKGVYVKASSQQSSLLTVSNMYISLVYWYKITDANLNVIRRYDEKQFPASKEVRQVNSISHNNYSGYFSTVNDSVVYVNSPAGKNAIITIPIKRIKDSLNIQTKNGIAYIGTKKLSINNASLTLEATDFKKTTLSPPPYLLLIKRGAVKENFFKNYVLPNRIDAVLAEYNSTTTSYTFDLSYYFSHTFKNSLLDTEQLEIIPVDITGTVNNPSYINYSLGLYGASLRTNINTSPLKIDFTISGF